MMIKLDLKAIDGGKSLVVDWDIEAGLFSGQDADFVDNEIMAYMDRGPSYDMGNDTYTLTDPHSNQSDFVFIFGNRWIMPGDFPDVWDPVDVEGVIY